MMLFTPFIVTTLLVCFDNGIAARGTGGGIVGRSSQFGRTLNDSYICDEEAKKVGSIIVSPNCASTRYQRHSKATAVFIVENNLLRGGDSDRPGGGGYYDDDDDNQQQSGGYNDYGGYGDYYDDNSRSAPSSPRDNYSHGDYSQQYYDDDGGDGYYDDRGYEEEDDTGRRRNTGRRGSSSNLPSEVKSILRHGNRKIGFMMLGSGVVLTFLGITLFFNKSLLRLGNLLFIGGVPMTLGPSRTMGYFLQPQKTRATGCLIFGIFLVFIGWPIFGMLLEVFGMLNLFGNMFPVLFAILKQMPVVGTLFGNNNNSSRRGNNKGNNRRQQEQRYEDNDQQYYGDYGDRGDDDDDRYY